MSVVAEKTLEVKYSEKTHRLTLTFPNGSKWSYTGIPSHVARRLENSRSRFGFYKYQIKGRYISKKLSEAL